MPGWGTGIGGLIGAAGAYFGGKKAAGTAPLSPIDLQLEQKKAIEGNLVNEGSIEALLSRSNSFNQDQSLSLMEKAMPGYTKLAGKLTGLASDLATNPYDLPPDVQANLQRQAAERGISVGGGSGSNFQGFSLLRDLGVNSLQYGQSRIGQAQGLTGLLAGIAPKVNPMSPLNFYVNPGQTAQIAAGNNQQQQEIAQSGLNANAAASNANSQSLWDSLAFAGAGAADLYANRNTGANKNGLDGASPNTAHSG